MTNPPICTKVYTCPTCGKSLNISTERVEDDIQDTLYTVYKCKCGYEYYEEPAWRK